MTTLGTPLSPHATKVMLLGSGELGKEVLIALQRLGVETIAVDRYDNAPGQQVAHHARTITMSDPAQLKALIEAERPHLVVPEIEAIATPMLEELEAAGTVRVIPTARAARLTARWMTAGFVHGVLNTDNMNITGESFDYGPYRFLPRNDPNFTAAYFDT